MKLLKTRPSLPHRPGPSAASTAFLQRAVPGEDRVLAFQGRAWVLVHQQAQFMTISMLINPFCSVPARVERKRHATQASRHNPERGGEPSAPARALRTAHVMWPWQNFNKKTPPQLKSKTLLDGRRVAGVFSVSISQINVSQN